MKIEDHIGILDKEVPTSLCNCIIDCISTGILLYHLDPSREHKSRLSFAFSEFGERTAEER